MKFGHIEVISEKWNVLMEITCTQKGPINYIYIYIYIY